MSAYSLVFGAQAEECLLGCCGLSAMARSGKVVKLAGIKPESRSDNLWSTQTRTARSRTGDHLLGRTVLHPNRSV
jgi:hypothetical protein